MPNLKQRQGVMSEVAPVNRRTAPYADLAISPQRPFRTRSVRLCVRFESLALLCSILDGLMVVSGGILDSSAYQYALGAPVDRLNQPLAAGILAAVLFVLGAQLNGLYGLTEVLDFARARKRIVAN